MPSPIITTTTTITTTTPTIMLPHHHASSQDPPTDQTSKPLLEAAEKGRADEVTGLLDCGADIETKDSVSGGGCYGAGLNAYLGGRGPILITKPLNPYYHVRARGLGFGV